MKILQIFNQYRFRGGEEVWVETVEKLLEGHAEVLELRFLSTDWSGPQAPSPIRQAQLIGNNPDSIRKLEERIDQVQPDVCLFHNVIPVASLGIYQAARSRNIPVIQYIHNFRPFSPSGTLWAGDAVNPAALSGNFLPEIFHGGWQGSRLKTLILSWHLRKAIQQGLIGQIDHWISPSLFMKQHFVSAGVPEDRITVIPHCHLGDITELTNTEKDYYLYLGRLENDKGIQLLLDAWSAYTQKEGSSSSSQLIIAGKGSLEQQVEEASRTLPRIKYVGHVGGAEKQALLDGCRAIIVPSICWESLGLTAYEAYSAGKPVIASRAGALQETVKEGETGWFFEPGNPADLTDTLLKVENSSLATRQQYGMAGAEWLRTNATADSWRDQFLGVCTRMAKKPQPVLLETVNR